VFNKLNSFTSHLHSWVVGKLWLRSRMRLVDMFCVAVQAESSSSSPARVRAQDSSTGLSICGWWWWRIWFWRTSLWWNRRGQWLHGIEGGGRGWFSFSCLRLHLSSSCCFLAISNDSTTPSLVFLLQAVLSLASSSQDCG